MSNDDTINLGAGGGGQEQRELVEAITQRLSNPLLDPLEDSAVLDLITAHGERLAFTTDSYVVSPWRFPGGDVGKLAVCGTVNDLAVMGGHPRYLSCGLIIEEGTARDDVLTAVDSMAKAAAEAGVLIVTGDCKVVERGHGDGIFINTTGLGAIPAGREFGTQRIRPGQALVVNGSLGDHAIAVMLCREGMDFESDIVSDCASLHELVETMIGAVGSGAIAAMRDLTRGGLAAVLNEYAASARCDMLIDEASLPVKPAVRAASRVLGFEPVVLANEGKLIAVVEASHAATLVAAMRDHPFGRDAIIIGEVGQPFDVATASTDRPRRPLVLFTTPSGGQRIVDMPPGELLPRIC